jgi:hypothetical protein
MVSKPDGATQEKARSPAGSFTSCVTPAALLLRMAVDSAAYSDQEPASCGGSDDDAGTVSASSAARP